jgi:hypothetical protein
MLVHKELNQEYVHVPESGFVVIYFEIESVWTIFEWKQKIKPYLTGIDFVRLTDCLVKCRIPVYDKCLIISFLIFFR